MLPEASFSEARPPAPFPRPPQAFEDVLSYPARFEAYFDDHFGFRNSLVQWNHRLKEALLHNLASIRGDSAAPGMQTDSTGSNPLPADPPVTEFDAVRFWKMVPGIERPRGTKTQLMGRISNSLGFRNEEFSRSKPEGTLRIVCFGDSCTFGSGVHPEDAWPSVLQMRLNESTAAARFEVVNAGVGAYTSYQGLRYMEQEVPELRADLVIATFGLADIWALSELSDSEQAPGYLERAARGESTHGPGFSVLMRPGRATIRGLGSPTRWRRNTQTIFDTSDPHKGYRRRVDLPEFEEHMRSMARLASEHGIECVFVLWAPINIVLEPDMRSNLKSYHEVTRTVAKQWQFRYVDLSAVFIEQLPESHGWYLDVMHVNEAGNRVVSDAIFPAIPRELLLSRLAPTP